MAERIYLEWRPAIISSSPWGHFYLVKREEPTNGQFNDLGWRQSGEVIRGASAGIWDTDQVRLAA